VVPIPHREPFLFVSAGSDGEALFSRFEPSNPYIADGSADPIVPRTLVLESLAQGLAVVAHRSFESTQSGVLAMVRDAEFLGDIRCSDKVELRITHQRTFAKLWWYVVRALRHGEGEPTLVASAQVVVAHLGSA
jgi:3-hydroxymyristoyl/3-hydroxydecanoyl-(acyl carrier protein) dehydratase